VTNAFSDILSAHSVSEPGGRVSVPVVVEAPAGAINFLVDNAKDEIQRRFFDRRLDQRRSPAGSRAMLSTHTFSVVLNEKLDAALNGSILFTRDSTRTR